MSWIERWRSHEDLYHRCNPAWSAAALSPSCSPPAIGCRPSRAARIKVRHSAKAGAIPVAVDLFDRESVRRALAGHDAIVNLATHLPPSTARCSCRALGAKMTACAATRQRPWPALRLTSAHSVTFKSPSRRCIPIAATAGSTKTHRSSRCDTTVRWRTQKRLRKGLPRPAASESSYALPRFTAPTPCRRSTWSSSPRKGWAPLPEVSPGSLFSIRVARRRSDRRTRGAAARGGDLQRRG